LEAHGRVGGTEGRLLIPVGRSDNDFREGTETFEPSEITGKHKHPGKDKTEKLGHGSEHLLKTLSRRGKEI